MTPTPQESGLKGREAKEIMFNWIGSGAGVEVLENRIKEALTQKDEEIYRLKGEVERSIQFVSDMTNAKALTIKELKKELAIESGLRHDLSEEISSLKANLLVKDEEIARLREDNALIRGGNACKREEILSLQAQVEVAIKALRLCEKISIIGGSENYEVVKEQLKALRMVEEGRGKDALSD